MQKKGRILVADDMSMNIFVIKRFLEGTDIIVDGAADGKEAVDLASQHKYDVIFLDYQMPKLSGLEALIEIRQIKLNENTPVLALSASEEEGDRENFIEVGFLDMLTKPIEPDKLMTFLDKYMVDSGEPANFFDRFSFLDVDAAMEYSMNQEELFKELLNIYISSSKIDEIEASYCRGDWADYERLVHGVKGMSRTIGANALADSAYALELAEKRSDFEFIRAGHDAFIAEYKEMLEKISKEV